MLRFFTSSRFAGRLLLVALFALIQRVSLAQAPSWQMAAAASSGGTVNEVATDSNGNVYLLGSFTTMTFAFGGLTFQNGDARAPGPEIFLIKWNTATNSAAWGVQSQGMGGSILPMGLAIAGSSVYVTGVVNGGRAFGGRTIMSTGAYAIQTIFVAKLTDAGTSASCTWVQYVSRASNLSLTPTGKKSAVVVSGANVYLTGQFNGTVGLGSTNLVSAGGTDGFVAKIVDAGTTSSFIWAQSFGGTGDEVPQSVAVSGTSVYVGGRFDGTSVLGATRLASAGGRDGFVAKFVDAGATGSIVWASALGGTSDDEVVSVAANGAGAYAAGQFVGTAAAGTTSMISAGGLDGFVGKLAATDGHFIWSKSFGGAGADLVGEVALLGTTIYSTGIFAGTASFGPNSLTSLGQYDVFLTKLTDAGTASTIDWAQQAGSTGYDVSNTISVTNGGVLYIGGQCDINASFAPLTLPATNSGAFVAAITDAAVALAINPEGPLAAWSLYPNPAKNRVGMQLPPIPGATTATLTLLDAVGRTAYTTTVVLPATGSQQDLSLTGLAPGLYALQVQAGGHTATRRLVIE